MSGTLPEDQAGLYVLGALSAEEMRAVRGAAGRDPALAAEIAAWERRLAPLARLVPEAAPPPTLWPQLEARLSRVAAGTGAPADSVKVLKMRRPARGSPSQRPVVFWRAAAAGAMALAASLAVVLVTRGPPRPAQLAMVLPHRPGEGGWLVEVNDRGELHVQASGALSRAADRDYELWALAEGADRPLPLGLMPLSNTTVIKANKLPSRKYQLLVSLEPKGGSPTGLPTGPVMYAGDVVTWR
jgi:anti-sigma-K factor RskA